MSMRVKMPGPVKWWTPALAIGAVVWMMGVVGGVGRGQELAGGAGAAGLPTGKRVSVSGDSVAALVEQLSLQSGMSFSFQARAGQAGVPGGAENPAVHVTLKDVPLWEAVERVQLAVGDASSGGQVVWRMGSDTRTSFQMGPPYSHAGGFLIRAGSITHNADFGRVDAEMYYVSVTPVTDGSVRILAMQHASAPTKAVDDAGNSLMPAAAPSVEWDLIADRGGSARLVTEPVRIMLARPKEEKPGGRKLAVLEGKLPVVIAAKVETLKLAVGAAEQREFAGVETKITYQRQNFGAALSGVEVNVAFTRPAGMGDEEWDRTSRALAATRVRMLDNPATPGGGESGNATRRSLSVIYTTGTMGEVEVEIPSELKVVEVPYRFAGLELP